MKVAERLLTRYWGYLAVVIAVAGFFLHGIGLAVVIALGLRAPHMKRPCQAFAGGRVVDHLMSVFRGCFCARFTCPPGLPVPAGWVRAAAAGRAG